MMDRPFLSEATPVMPKADGGADCSESSPNHHGANHGRAEGTGKVPVNCWSEVLELRGDNTLPCPRPSRLHLHVYNGTGLINHFIDRYN